MFTPGRYAILLTSVITAMVGGASTAIPAAAAPGPPEGARVLSIFPTNDLAVPDATQRTGLRVNLPLPDCTAQPTDCNTVRLLNQLDGFDLDPRVALHFDRPVDPAAVAAQGRIEGAGTTTGLDRVVYDSATRTVYAHPVNQLRPGTTYTLRTGAASLASSPFTTLSATDGLTDMVGQLDNGSAYRAAGITPTGLQVDASFPAEGTTFTYTSDRGSSTSTSGVINTSGDDPRFGPSRNAGTYVFGSYLAPSWLTLAGDIPQTPTGDAGPRVTGSARLPFVAIVPKDPAPAGGFPVAVFGHGYSRSDVDLFTAAPQNAEPNNNDGVAKPEMVTIATDVVGHGFGPRSTWNVTTTSAGATTTVSVPAHARGIDRDGDGTIGDTEGLATLPQPAPLAQIGARDGLRQTAADVASLVRAVGRTPMLAGTALRGTAAVYYGQSLGGMYGTMLGGVDRSIAAFGLNVPGGPFNEFTRLAPTFRPLVVNPQLAGARPRLLNGGTAGFTESMPLAGQPPVTAPAPGALPIQQFLADGNWLDRPGSPETFAPLLPRNNAGDPVRVLVQSAFGDQSVPNPTTGTLIRAGGLEKVTSFYRNDLTAAKGINPHTFLLDPRFAGNELGQTQMTTFLASGGGTIIAPAKSSPLLEVPIANPDVLRSLNFLEQSVSLTSSPPEAAVVGVPYPVTATATSGLPVTFRAGPVVPGELSPCQVDATGPGSATVTVTGAGTCTVTATAPSNGDGTLAVASAAQTFATTANDLHIAVTPGPSVLRTGPLALTLTVANTTTRDSGAATTQLFTNLPVTNTGGAVTSPAFLGSTLLTFATPNIPAGQSIRYTVATDPGPGLPVFGAVTYGTSPDANLFNNLTVGGYVITW